MANQTEHYPCSGWFFIIGEPTDREIEFMLDREIIGYLLPNFQFGGEC